MNEEKNTWGYIHIPPHRIINNDRKISPGYETWLSDKFGMDIYTEDIIRYIEIPIFQKKLTHFQRFMKFLKKTWRKIWKYGKKVFTLWNK